MPTTKLPSGESVRYSYDSSRDELVVHLRESSHELLDEPHPLAERVVVQVEEDTGLPVMLRVRGVQTMILEAIIRDLVLSLEPAAEAPADPAQPTEPQARPAEPAEPQADPAGSAASAGPTDTVAAEAADVEAQATTEAVEVTDTSDAITSAPAEVEVQPEPRPEEVSETAAVAEADESRRDDRIPESDDQEHGTAPPSEDGGFAQMTLDPRLSAAIADMGFVEPTPIQRRAVPEVLAGHDVIGLAQTGTGKTIAFLLPGLQHLLEKPLGAHHPRLLVVTPTRELAVQVATQASSLASRTDLRTTCLYGGSDMKRQTSELRRGADVIVATPGRLLDHVRRRNADLSGVGIVVLDEADRMLDMGFLPDVREILRHVPDERQTLLFGATLPPPIESLSLQFQRDPVLVEVARRLPPDTIDQKLFPVGKHLKLPLLVHLLTNDPDLRRVLVFTERRSEADVVARRLQDAGLKVAVMHGDRSQRDRERSLRQLRSGEVQALVATNVAARGLDIEDVSHVVSYDVPQTVDEYVHRIGRTARADASGNAYTFIAPGDEWMVRRIESALERELPRVVVEDFDYDVPTPSWAQPSADDVARSLEKPSSAAEVSRRMRRR